MGGLSWWHWLIILGAFVLLFGAKRLPDVARGVGRSVRILKSEVGAMSEDDKADDDKADDDKADDDKAAAGETAAADRVAAPTDAVSNGTTTGRR